MERNSGRMSATLKDKPLLLIVEDGQDDRNLITDCLDLENCAYITAASVAEAKCALKTEGISLMVLDWHLDRRGAEVLRFARELDPRLPVLVISGHPNDPRTEAFDERADAFLEKPFNLTVFVNQVVRLLLHGMRAPKEFLPESVASIQPLEEVKTQYILSALKLLNNNISLTAEELGVHRQTVAAALKRARSTAANPPAATVQMSLSLSPDFNVARVEDTNREEPDSLTC